MATGKKFALSVIIEAVDKITAPLKAVQDRIDKTFAPVRKLGGAFKELGEASGINKLGEKLGGLAEKMKGVGEGFLDSFKRLGELALAETGLAFLIKQTGEAGKELTDMAARAGMGVQEYQQLQYAAKRAGVEQEQFNMAMRTFAVNVGEVHARTGSLYTLLARVAPNLEERVRGAKSTGEAFTVIMDAIGRLKDPAKQAALAAAAFGGRGEEMVNIAHMGSAALAKLKQRFVDLHGGFTDEGAKGAAEFTDSLQDMMVALTGAKNRIIGALFPALEKLIGKLTDYIVKHGPEWVEWAQNFAKGLPDTLKKLQAGFETFMAVLDDVIGAVKWLADTFGGANVALAALAAFIFGPLIASLVALVPAIYAVGAALLTTPIGWIVLGIAAIVAAILYLHKHWDAIWEAIGATVAGVVDTVMGWWDKLMEKIGDVIDWIVDGFTKAVTLLEGLVPNWIKNLFGGKASVTVNGSTTTSAATVAAPASMVPGAQVPAAAGAQHQVAMSVVFKNAPPGTSVREDKNTGVPLDMFMGYHSVTP